MADTDSVEATIGHRENTQTPMTKNRKRSLLNGEYHRLRLDSLFLSNGEYVIVNMETQNTQLNISLLTLDVLTKTPKYAAWVMNAEVQHAPRLFFDT